jgi:hypothetical protein
MSIGCEGNGHVLAAKFFSVWRELELGIVASPKKFCNAFEVICLLRYSAVVEQAVGGDFD